MESLKFINIFPYVFLNPVTLVVYLGICSSLESSGMSVKTTVSTNTDRYHLRSYLLAAPILTAFFILLKVITLHTLANEQITFIDLVFVQPNFIWLIAYSVCFFVLKVCVSKNGMEANVMGFIFFPPLLCCSAVLAGMHFYWIWTKVL